MGKTFKEYAPRKGEPKVRKVKHEKFEKFGKARFVDVDADDDIDSVLISGNRIIGMSAWYNDHRPLVDDRGDGDEYEDLRLGVEA